MKIRILSSKDEISTNENEEIVNTSGEIMGIFKTIYEKVYDTIKAINLKQPEKLKLIELLLIVGSILIAFKAQPYNITIIFMIYLVASIIYYIFIQSLTLELNGGKNYLFNLIPLFIAVIFSTILNVNIFLNTFSQFPTFSTILYILYFIMFSFIIYAALANLSSNQSKK